MAKKRAVDADQKDASSAIIVQKQRKVHQHVKGSAIVASTPLVTPTKRSELSLKWTRAPPLVLVATHDRVCTLEVCDSCVCVDIAARTGVPDFEFENVRGRCGTAD